MWVNPPPVMAEITSAPPTTKKPVIVRVKRKAFQSPLDAFCKYWSFKFAFLSLSLLLIFLDYERWFCFPLFGLSGLEIQERPLKRPLIDFAKLSISDASSSRGMLTGALHCINSFFYFIIYHFGLLGCHAYGGKYCIYVMTVHIE